jgi:hypothetical protein
MGNWLVNVRLRNGARDTFFEALSRSAPILEDNGWTLLGGYETEIGPLDEYIDIWDVGPDAAGAGAAIQASLTVPGFADAAALLNDIVISEDTAYVEPCPYSPAGYTRTHGGSVILVRAQLKYGRSAQLYAAMAEALPILADAGLRLLGAYETRIGRLFEYWHFWEPRLNSSEIAPSLEAVLSNAQEKDQEFARIRATLTAIVVDRDVRIMKAVPFAH